jgi:squalene cyclase
MNGAQYAQAAFNPDGSPKPADSRRKQTSIELGDSSEVRAMAAAQNALLLRYNETGAWPVSCDGGPAATAMVVSALHFIGELGDGSAEQKAAVQRVADYLVSCQHMTKDGGDGGFPAAPGATTGELSTTALCLAGLIATGAPKQNIDDAYLFIDDNGGMPEVLKRAHGLDLGALALAMVKAIPHDNVPRPPVAFELAPGAAEVVMEHRFAFVLPFRALTTGVILHHMADEKPWRLPAASFDGGAGGGAIHGVARAIETASEKTGAHAASLIRDGATAVERATRTAGRMVSRVTAGGVNAGERTLRGVRSGPGRLFKAIAQNAIDVAGGVYGGVQTVLGNLSRVIPEAIDNGVDLARSAQGLRCELYLRRFENADGSYLYGDSMHTALALAALHAIGVPRTDKRFVKGLRWLRTQRVKAPTGERYDIFSTDVWPTCFTIRALLASGVPVTDPAITRAANWLISIQRRGSWAFQGANSTTPDADDTAVALAALAMVREHLLAAKQRGERISDYLLGRCDAAIADARRWLLGFQNADGGWASYQQGLPSKPPGPIMTKVPDPPADWRALLDAVIHPQPEFGDPATEDLTGRVLYGLGKAGARANEHQIRAAIQFLELQQASNGGWWGRWVVNFVAGTAWVLRGLAAVGAPRTRSIERGIAFLLDHQNADGGWGEAPDSYRKPEDAGKGTSNPCLTGLVVCALIELGDQRLVPSIQRGIEFLLAHYELNDGWTASEQDLLHTLFPPNLFYTLPLSELHMPLEALGLFIAPAERMHLPKMKDGQAKPAPDLDAFDRMGDKRADDLIEQLRRKGPINIVNDLLAPLMRSVDLPPQGSVPDSVLKFLDDTDDLPKDLDRDKIKRAQQMFERCGWGVGTTLFCSSLPQCYAFDKGARVLLATGEFKANARRRIMETAQLLFDVATPGGLEPGGRGIRTAQKVRLLHAGIRSLVQPGWPKDGSKPLSQLQMLGTLMTFSSVVTDGLVALGFNIEADEAEAWFYLWQVVGPILGIPADIIPDDLAQGRALFDQMRARSWGPSPQGSELTRLTLKAAHELIPGEEFDDLAEAMVRHLAGDHCADILDVPRTDWTSFLTAVSFLDRLKDVLFGDRLPSSTLVALLQRASFQLMRALAQQQREGKGVLFTIPTHLEGAWFNDFSARFRQ